MTIDGIKYKNVFTLFYCEGSDYRDEKEMECIICQKNLINKKCYAEGLPENSNKVGIFIVDKNEFMLNKDMFDSYYIYICKECGRTPRNSEVIVIPFLKIMYGRRIKVSRVNEETKEIKEFNY